MLQTTAPDRPSSELASGLESRRAGGALILGLGALAVLHALVLVWQGVGPVDDDYIVYRYARNWLESGALTFQPPGWSGHTAPVEGFTSPLWLCLCALAQLLGIAPETWTPAIGAGSAGLATLWAGWAARAVAPLSAGRWVLVVPFLMALSPSLAWHAVAGLGTAPMAAALALAVFAAVRSKLGLFALASAVAVSFRLEALVAILPLGVAAARGGTGERSSKAGVLRWVGPALFVVGLITCMRWWLFSQIAPSTYFVKRLPLSDELGYGAHYLLRAFTEGGLGVLAFAAIVARSVERPAIPRSLAAATVLALAYVLACGGDWMVYGRFLVPFLPVFAVGAGLLVVGLKNRTARGIVALVLMLFTLMGLRPDVRSQAIFEHRFFEAWWLRVGDELRERAPEGSSIALSPIGAIGWRSGLPIVDVLGLTHDAFHGLEPDLESVGVKGHHRHDGSWVLDQEPTYLLLGNAVLQPATGTIDVNPWEADIAADPRFRRDYVAETAWVTEPDGARHPIPYFRRRSAQPIRP
jgi:hypothetical protein